MADQYRLAEVSFDLLRGESWERIAKFLVAHVIAGIVVAVLVVFIGIPILQTQQVIGAIFIIGVVLMGNAGMLAWYEKWRGCHFVKQRDEN